MSMARRAEPGVMDQPALRRRLILIFAVAAGLTVANNYYAQPLLPFIARSFHSDPATIGLIVTLTQVGYGLGLAFLVPLGDLVNRRRLILLVLSGTTLTLLVTMLAPSLPVLLLASLGVGLTSVVAQILVPFIADLAPAETRGRVVGTVMSGLLIGILLARTAAGLISQLHGWRSVYGVAAILMLALMVTLWYQLPRETRRHRPRVSYWQLLGSLLTLTRDEPVLRRRALYGATIFGAFSVFWTSMAFLLAGPPYGYSQAVIGLFGLAGLAGAIMASVAGRLSDRGLACPATGGFLLAELLSFGLLLWGGHILLAFAAGVVLLDLGAQGVHITNQGVIYALRPDARSRLTTVYMTTYFIGGALGSASSAYVYARVGWSGVCLLGAAYLVVGLAVWLTEWVRR